MGLIIASSDRPGRSTKIICTPSRWLRPRINSESRLLQNDAGGRATFHMPCNWTFSSTWNPHLTLNVGFIIVFKLHSVVWSTIWIWEQQARLHGAATAYIDWAGEPQPYIAWCVCIACITRKSLMTWTRTLSSEGSRVYCCRTTALFLGVGGADLITMQNIFHEWKEQLFVHTARNYFMSGRPWFLASMSVMQTDGKIGSSDASRFPLEISTHS